MQGKEAEGECEDVRFGGGSGEGRGGEKKSLADNLLLPSIVFFLLFEVESGSSVSLYTMTIFRVQK